MNRPSLPIRSVALLGPWPPPYGGVSKHVERLVRRLARSGLPARVYSYTKETGDPHVVPRPRAPRPFGRMQDLFDRGKWVDEDLVHCHESWYRNSNLLLRFVQRCVPLVITVHNELEARVATVQPLIASLAVPTLVASPAVSWIAVSQAIREQLETAGVHREQIDVIPAYLPRDENTEDRIPEGLERFIASHDPVLAVYGWKLAQLDGRDLYGFGDAIAMFARLRGRFPAAGLVVLCPGVELTPASDFLALRTLAAELGVEDDVCWQTAALADAESLWRRCDLYVRPSLTDGDAVAIRECLAVGVPVVASDAVARAAEVRTYSVGNADAFLDAVHGALTASRQPAASSDDLFPRIMEAYGRAERTRGVGRRRA